MRLLRTVGFGLAAVALLVPSAEAATIDLAHPTFAPFQSSNIGSNVDRSVVFDASVNFSITSAGIFFDPLVGGATAIAVDIFASNLAPGQPNNQHGALLATASTAIVDAGLGFYDIPIAFNFLAGQRYDVAFRSLSPGGWGTGLNSMRFYNFDFFVGNPAYSVDGLVRVLDGACHGLINPDCSSYGNFVMPNVRFNAEQAVIPEPATVALIGAGLLGALRRRRTAR